uniref:Uncharacterized protein n=1 Tax=Arundo donax TaxID=35708 RepID=A0A0A8Y9T3_ARUDO
MAGDTWTLVFHCPGKPAAEEFFRKEVDKDDICHYNLILLVEKLGYAARDFLYYKRRQTSKVASLQLIDYDADVARMVREHESERKVRFILTKEQLTELKVSISPIKRSRGPPVREETLNAYKEWLKLQDPNLGFKDDFREKTIEAYKEWLEEQGELADIIAYLEEQSQDSPIPALETDDSTPSPTNWPSHARRNHKKPASGQARKKGGRGTLKGLTAGKKRIMNGSQKLEIQFSTRLGGPIGINYRSFVDEIVMYTRKKAPSLE